MKNNVSYYSQWLYVYIRLTKGERKKKELMFWAVQFYNIKFTNKSYIWCLEKYIEKAISFYVRMYILDHEVHV